MSVQSAEYVSDMKKVIDILESWKEWSPDLERAIEIIKDTIWWEDEQLK
jgi:hypothetical protein